MESTNSSIAASFEDNGYLSFDGINDYVDFADQASKFATNKLTVGRNGKNIQTLAEDLEINVANTSTRLTYTGTTNGWVLS